MTQRLESMEMNGEDDDNNDDKKEAIRSADEHQSRCFQEDEYLENAKTLPTDGGASAWRDAFAVKIEQTPKAHVRDRRRGCTFCR